MEKAAKTKSKETVAAISRPTSIAMPSNTKRSLAGKARAKKQGEGVQKLLAQGPGGKDDDDDDPDAVPSWIGTSLHGLSKRSRLPTCNDSRSVLYHLGSLHHLRISS